MIEDKAIKLGGNNLLKNFEPNKLAKNIYEITVTYLEENNLRGIITDLDNTLIRWDHFDASEELKDWLRSFSTSGIKIVICSNNNEERVKDFAQKVGLPFVSNAYKPFGAGLKNALAEINLSAQEVAVLGDQLMTDVLGGNRLAMHTILVEPMASTDDWKTKFNRFFEKQILKYLRKKGHLTEKEKL